MRSPRESRQLLPVVSVLCDALLRRRYGTVTWLAEATGYSQSTISEYLGGHVVPSLGALTAMARALNLEVTLTPRGK